MTQCKQIQSVHRKVCVGDMRDEIQIQNRSITATVSSPDFSETFVNTITVFALIKTVKGETIFDGTDTEVDVTHHFYLRFIDGITSETWILFNNTRFTILNAEDLDERDEYWLLQCSDRGTDANAASQA